MADDAADKEDAPMALGGSSDEEGDTQPVRAKAGKWPCMCCKKSVTSSGVRCNTCQLWVHVKCQQIPKELYAILRNPAKFGRNISWNCDSCLASGERLEAKMKRLEGRVVEVENKSLRTDVAVADLTSKVDSVERKQGKMEDTLEKERERIRRERAEELREQQVRRKNIIVYRMEEANNSVVEASERREWDLASCENLFAAAKLSMNRAEILFCRRIGEKGDMPRPMGVGFKREAQKEDMLDSVRNLRGTPFEEVGIAPDLTKEQREDEQEMAREAEKGEKRLIKVVEREGERERGQHSRGGQGLRLLSNRGFRRGQWIPGGAAGRGRGGPDQRGGGAGAGRENLLEYVRGGMGGARQRLNSKRLREDDVIEERDQPTAPGMASQAAV